MGNHHRVKEFIGGVVGVVLVPGFGLSARKIRDPEVASAVDERIAAVAVTGACGVLELPDEGCFPGWPIVHPKRATLASLFELPREILPYRASRNSRRIGIQSALRFPEADLWLGIASGLPLALIGNASGQIFARRGISIRGVFDKEVRRKPLAFAADAWSYGI